MTIGHVMLDVNSYTLTPVEREMISHPQTGGIILFARNYESKKQLRALTKSLRKIKQDILIAVDQEGGRVQRFKNEFTTLPPFKFYGNLYEKDPAQAKNYAEKMAYLMAKELLECGVNVSFSPVLDIDRGQSEVIGDRSFHHRAEIVIELAGAFIRGMRQAGMPATGKHFPGHGAVFSDSHQTLPIDLRLFDEIESTDLQPFARLNQQLDGIMTAHILYEKVDSTPTCFSAKWLKEILREKMKFEGVIFSDDLSMAGAEFVADYTMRSEKALVAGCDMILVCNQQTEAIKVLEHLEKYQDLPSEHRLELFANMRR